MSESMVDRWLPKVWQAHVAYDAVTGVWPLVDMASFEAITGRKTDRWLVKTVAVLVLVTGGVIGAAGARQRITPEIAALAIGSSAALATIDVVYVSKRRISRVYLLDVVASLALITGWYLAIARKRIPLTR